MKHKRSSSVWLLGALVIVLGLDLISFSVYRLSIKYTCVLADYDYVLSFLYAMAGLALIVYAIKKMATKIDSTDEEILSATDDAILMNLLGACFCTMGIYCIYVTVKLAINGFAYSVPAAILYNMLHFTQNRVWQYVVIIVLALLGAFITLLGVVGLEATTTRVLTAKHNKSKD